MAFSNSEIQRIQYELGYNLLDHGAVVYVETTMLFQQVVQGYIDAEVATTSSTTVTATSTPTPVAITLASATGFAAGQRVVIDVDSRQESATIAALSGASATVQLKNAHSGTYPVSVEGPITIAKECLKRIADVKAEMAGVYGWGPLKKVDEVEFHAGSGGSHFGRLGQQLAFWRNELASVLGVPFGPGLHMGGGCSALSVY